MGEMIGLRISTGVYITGLSESFPDGGMGTAWHGHQYGNDYLLKGVPMFMEYMGMANASSTINGEMCLRNND